MAVLGAWALAALAVAAAMGGSAGSVLVPLTLLAGCGAALLAEWSLEAHPRAPGVVVLALVVALSWDLARGVEAAWAREAADPARAEHDLLARYGRADRRCQAVVDSPEALAPYVLHFGGEPRVVRSEGELIWELGALGWDRCWYFYHGREVAGERPPRPGAEAARKLVLSHGFSEVLSSRVGGEAVFLAKREAAPPGQGI
jgi:hypothetical protein